jgi:hypothetical protein
MVNTNITVRNVSRTRIIPQEVHEPLKSPHIVGGFNMKDVCAQLGHAEHEYQTLAGMISKLLHRKKLCVK